MNGISQDEYDLAFTRLRELDADIDLIKTRINKSSIEAPFDGTIGLRMASMGAYVSPGDIITTLVQLNPIKIEFNVPEKYATFIKKGQIVNFQLSGGEKVYQGTIYATDPFIDPSIRALKVRALAENQENSLVPGAFVELTLELERINNALLIPTTAIVPLMNSQNVFVLKNGLAISTEIKTGIRKESLIQVTEGVTVGDSIAVTGLLSLRNRMPVTVSKIIQE
jgi:membrane fusion protein (multidrug efflux system)